MQAMLSSLCQGRMPQSVRERYLKMKEPHHPANLMYIQNFDCALSHPDADDLETQTMLELILLIRPYKAAPHS
ncbi:MAG: flavodoxin family protein [Clostridia bacterium]